MLKASAGTLKFPSVIEAFRELGIPLEKFQQFNIVVWSDSYKEADFFKNLKPWQVINRIPNINILCRKASFAFLIQQISKYFPKEYEFVPKSYILPYHSNDFTRALSKRKERYIVKPDSGSFGYGITIVRPEDDFSPTDELAVAQRFIPSFLWDETKFDLRIYVLVASVNPFEVFLYRDGVARFASEKDNGNDSIFSQITNVELNKANINMEDIDSVSKLISDLFEEFENKGINTQQLWEKIDHIVVLALLSAHNYLIDGVNSSCHKIGYPRCFQILGFDILLDKNLNPHILEVNHRPSLQYYRGPERRMKVGMIADAIKVAFPLPYMQQYLDSRRYCWSNESWCNFINSEQIHIDEKFHQARQDAAKQTKFAQIYPCNSEDRMALYKKIISVVDTFPLTVIPGVKGR